MRKTKNQQRKKNKNWRPEGWTPLHEVLFQALAIGSFAYFLNSIGSRKHFAVKKKKKGLSAWEIRRKEFLNQKNKNDNGNQDHRK